MEIIKRRIIIKGTEPERESQLLMGGTVVRAAGLIDGTKTSASAVHDDVPVGQAHQVLLLHRADTIARWSDVAHSETTITDAELRIRHAEVGAAGAVVAVLVGTVEEVGEVLHITMLLLNSLNEGLRGDVLTMLIGTQTVALGWKLLTATREEHVVGRFA